MEPGYLLSRGADGSVLCMWQLVVLVLTWRSAVLALQLGLDDVKAITICPEGVDTCNGRNIPHRTYDEYQTLRCFCDDDCHLFGECCIDRAVRKDTPLSASGDGPTDHLLQDEGLSQDKLTSDVRGEIQETTDVLGIPRDRWGCQNLVITKPLNLPTKKVRMVVKCPADISAEMFQKCAALDRNSSGFHYSMDIPVLSLNSGIWYRNVFCAMCNRDGTNLAPLTYSLWCEHNYTREEVVKDGQYSTEPLDWIMNGRETSRCRLTTELQPGESPGFLRPCGKNITNHALLIIENCPSDWTDHETAQKCKAYAFYSEAELNSGAMDRSSVLAQIFKNPHCALCNGVPPLNITCWSPMWMTIETRSSWPSLSTYMHIRIWQNVNQQHRSCRPPDDFWDVLHETCIKLINEDVRNMFDGTFNQSCPVITLAASEYQIIGNGSLQYIGNNSHYVGHIFDKFRTTDNKSAIVCALHDHRATDDLISGAYEGYLTGFCLSVSVICLILHVGIYCALPKLSNLPGKNLLSLSWAILLAHFLLLVAVKPEFEVPPAVCIGIAVVEYYCLLAAFFWMNVMSVDIWRTFSGSTLRGSDGLRTHRKYAIYAWGTAALLALAALTVDLCIDDGAVKPSFGKGQDCWFGNQGGLVLFLTTPLFILLMVNSGLFATTVYRIWQAQRQGERYIHKKRRDEVVQTSMLHPTDSTARVNNRGEGSRLSGRKDQIRFYLYLKLFIIMGLTWIFGFIAEFARVQFLWYPFIVFNGLQGAFIFVMFDMKRKIGYMLWDKYISHRGYEPPGFLMASSTTSATRKTGSGESDPAVATKRSASPSVLHLSTPVPQ